MSAGRNIELRRPIRLRRTDIHGRDYYVWVASAGCGDSCGHDHPTRALAKECASLAPRRRTRLPNP